MASKPQVMRVLAIALPVLVVGVLVYQLGPWGGDGGLSDPDPLKRMEALEPLMKPGAPLNAKAMDRLLDDPVPSVVYRTIVTLQGRLQDDQTHEKLLQLARTAADKDVRRAAIAELGNFKQTDVNTLIGLAGTPDPEVKKGAALAMGRLKDLHAVPSLLAMLRDDDPRVRAHALAAIANITTLRFRYDASKPYHEQKADYDHIVNRLRSAGS